MLVGQWLNCTATVASWSSGSPAALFRRQKQGVFGQSASSPGGGPCGAHVAHLEGVDEDIGGTHVLHKWVGRWEGRRAGVSGFHPTALQRGRVHPHTHTCCAGMPCPQQTAY